MKALLIITSLIFIGCSTPNAPFDDIQHEQKTSIGKKTTLPDRLIPTDPAPAPKDSVIIPDDCRKTKSQIICY